MRKLVAIIVAVIVTASCIPWLRHQRFFSVLVAITTVVLAGLIVLGIVQTLARWSGKESQPRGSTQSGWWTTRLRNLSLGAGVVLVLMLTVPHFLATSSGAYRLAMTTANQTPQFTEVLGAPIRETWFSGGRTEYGNPARAELTIPVSGSKQKGDLQVVAIKKEGHWQLRELTLELTRSGERIDLLSTKTNPGF